MFNLIVSDMLYLEPFNFVDFYLKTIYLIYVYKADFALDNQQWLICHKPQPNKINCI